MKWIQRIEKICDTFVVIVATCSVIIIVFSFVPSTHNDRAFAIAILLFALGYVIAPIVILVFAASVVAAFVSAIIKIIAFSRRERFITFGGGAQLVGLALYTLAVFFNLRFTLIGDLISSYKRTVDFDTLREQIAAEAKQTHNPSLCDKIPAMEQGVPPQYRDDCYMAADPGFPKYMETCELYPHINQTQAEGLQAQCIRGHLYADEKTSTNIIDCQALGSKYASFGTTGGMVEECKGAATIQKAVMHSDSKVCDDLLSEIQNQPYFYGKDLFTMMHAACVVHFIGSQEWKNGCSLFADHVSMGLSYRDLAKCTGTRPIPQEYISQFPYYFQ